MKKYQFSSRSLRSLDSCHQDLQAIAHQALLCTQVDFAITEGHRSLERQYMLYQAGRSRINGKTKQGKHNQTPSMAFDVCAIVKGRACWTELYLSYLGGVFGAVGDALLDQGIVTHRLRWGGNWDQDGEIITDQTFIDLPHFELQAV